MSFGFGLGFPRRVGEALRASAAFNFLSGVLDPRITFSRTTNATLIGSDGTLQYAPHNLLTYSEQFDNAVWAKVQGTVTANATISPDGTTTADVFIPDTNAGDHGIVGLLTSQDLSITRTFSIYLKASGLTTFAIYVRNNAQTIGIQGNVDLSAGTITASNYGAPISVLTPTITAVGNGWFRCTIGGALSATTETLRVGILRNFTGDGVSGLYVWGGQINVGALQPYYSTTVKNLLGYSQEFDNAAWSKVASSIATNLLTYSEQFDNAAWTKSNSFVQTNQIRNNTMQGAVAGTPGTLPTNWSTFTLLTGLTREVVGTGTETGIRYIDIRLSGTPSAAGTYLLLDEANNGVAALTGQAWTHSLFVALAAGSTTGVSSITTVFEERTSANAFLAEQISTAYTITATALGGTRQSKTATTNGGATTAFLNAYFRITLTGAAIDFTIRIGLPQLVQGAVAGDVVQTYGTARAVMYSAPDGSLTADKFAESETSGTHYTSQVYSNSNALLTFSIYIKAAERSIVRLQLSNNSTGAAAAFFDASSGTISSAASDGGDFTGSTATITAVGNGWYRCSLTTLKGAVNTTAWPYVALASTGTTTSYTGDGTSGIYVWGAQLVQSGAAETYQRTGATIRPIGYTAPDGSLTADKLVADISTGPHYITPSPALSLVVGQVLTYSVYAKAAERTFLQLILTGVGAGPTNLIAGFDLVAGVAGTPSAGSTSSIVAVGNGWYRCGITTPIATAGTPTQQIRVAQNSSSTPSSYTGDGTSGIYIWGAQFSDSASLDPYFYNPAAAPSNTAYYGPRFDYDPVTLAAKGLLIEEQRTNQQLYSEDLSQWGTPANATVSTNVAVAPDGFTTADKLVEDTATSSHFLSAGSITHSYVSGTLYTRSCFLKAAERFIVSVYLPGSAFPQSNRQALFNLNTGTVYSVEPNVTASIQAVGNGWYRCTVTATANVTGVGHVGGSALIDNSGNGTYTGDGVSGALIWGGQMEVATFSTSYIPTTTTALTRAADVASVTGANFSNWYNSVEGTLFVEGSIPFLGGSSFPAFASVDDGTSGDAMELSVWDAASDSVRFVVWDGGSSQASIVAGTYTANTVLKLSGTYKVNDFAASYNGAAAVTDTSGTLPTVSLLRIGQNRAAGNPLNGHIRSFNYYNTRLSNATLQSLTFAADALLFDAPETSGHLLTSGIL